MGTQLPSTKRAEPLQFSTHICCGRTAGWIKMPLGMEVGLGPGDFVIERDPAPARQQGTAPTQFLAHVYRGKNGCVYQDTTWYGGRPQSRRHCVRWGPSSPSAKGAHPLKGHSPQFSADVRCGQRAGWTKMPLGTEVDLGPGHAVLDVDPAPPVKGAQQPLFSAYVFCGHGCQSKLLLSSCYHCSYGDVKYFENGDIRWWCQWKSNRKLPVSYRLAP